MMNILHHSTVQRYHIYIIFIITDKCSKEFNRARGNIFHKKHGKTIFRLSSLLSLFYPVEVITAYMIKMETLVIQNVSSE